MIRVITVAVVCLLLGIVIGASIFGGSSAPADPPLAPPTAEKNTPSDTTPEPTPIPTASLEPPSVDFPESADLLARALAEIPFDAPEKHSGEIRGVVLTGTGKPVVGAIVRAWPLDRDGFVSMPSAESSTLEERVRVFVQQQRESAISKVEDQTDESGEFSLLGIGPGDYRVSSFAKGVEFPSQHSIVAAAGDVLEFLGNEQAIARITVDAGTGRHNYVRVEFKAGHTSRSKNWYYEEGGTTFSLPAGEYTVTAKTGNYSSDPIEVTMVLGEETPVHLVLNERPQLSGEILLPADERPSSTYSVTLIPRGEGEEPTPETTRGFPGTSSTGTRFQITDLRVGSYWLMISRGRRDYRELGAMTPVEIRPGSNVIDVTLPPVDRSQAIRVLAFDNRGNPLIDPELHFRLESDRGSSTFRAKTISMKDGSCWAIASEHDASDHLNPRIFLTGSHQERQKATVEATGGWGSTVELFLQPVSDLIVQILSIPPNIQRVRVRLSSANNPRLGILHAKRDENGFGEVSFEGLETGPAQLAISASTGLREVEMLTMDIQIRPDAPPIAVPLPHYPEVVVIAPDGFRSGFILEGEQNHHAITDNGQVIFPLVAPGQYELVAYATGQRIPISVPTDGPIHFEPAEPTGLTVKISSSSGVLAQAGFHDRDFIVAVDGVTTTSAEQLRMLGIAMAAEEMTTIRFTIVRGGTELDLEVDPAALLDANPGGGFFPAYP